MKQKGNAHNRGAVRALRSVGGMLERIENI